MSTTSEAITFELNGARMQRHVPSHRILVDMIRDECHLTGTKISCDQNACGACTVLIDGAPRASCSTFAFEVSGRAVTTIEGLANKDAVCSALQAAFNELGAFQCGFCTSGMLTLGTHLLRQHLNWDADSVRDAINGNWCRCTGYQVIVDAIVLASSRLGAADEA